MLAKTGNGDLASAAMPSYNDTGMNVRAPQVVVRREACSVKTIGLIGGLSFESTVEYYRLINEEVQRRLGGVHSARMVLYSFDFEEIEKLQHAGRWEEMGLLMGEAGALLQRAGADFIVIGSNTMHKLAPEVEAAAGIPVLHIADATGRAIRAAGIGQVGLLGTSFTMEEPFLKGFLEERYALSIDVPDASGRLEVDRVIYEELVVGTIRDTSRERYRAIISRLLEEGSGGVILGCTEIGLLIGPDDVAAPVFDTTRLHALAAVDEALGEGSLAQARE